MFGEERMKPTLNIIGAGRLGRVLGHAWHEAGTFSIQGVYARSLASAEEGVRFIGGGFPVSQIAALEAAEVWLIATPDSVIESVCHEIALLLRPGDVVFHCSGAFDCGILQAARARGASVASTHPADTFVKTPSPQPRALHGTPVVSEGDDRAIVLLKTGFTEIGAEWHLCSREQKTRYHLACVFASNFLHTLQESAARVIEGCGLPRTVLHRIIHTSIQNFLAFGGVRALTGPIVRGDVQTLTRHLQAFTREEEDLRASYIALAEQTTAILSGVVSEQALREIRQSLKSGGFQG